MISSAQISEKDLIELTSTNDAFSKITPGVQLAWDTVSGGNLKTCAKKYFYFNICGYVSKHENVHLRFGLLLHLSREHYDLAKSLGDNHEVALVKTVRKILEASGDRVNLIKCSACGAVNTNTEIPSCLTCNSDQVELVENVFVPWQSDHKNKNRHNLIRTIVWYFENYKNSPEKTIILENGKPAVELWFRLKLELEAPDGSKYILTGHLDRLIDVADSNWFADLKSTKNTINDKFFEQFFPNNQMSHYTVSSKIVFQKPILGGMIDAAQVAVNFTAFQRGFVQLTPEQADEWLDDMQYWIKLAEKYAADRHWPMNDTACHHYGGCEFLGVCSKSPSSRQNYLDTKFKRTVWNPLKERT